MSDYDDRPVRRSPPPPPPPPHFQTEPPIRGYIPLIIVGIVILLVGGIIYVSWGFIDDPDESSDSDAREEYSDNIRTMAAVGDVIQYIGLIILSVGLLMGAITDNNLPINVRLAMILAMSIIIGFKISSTVIPYLIPLAIKI